MPRTGRTFHPASAGFLLACVAASVLLPLSLNSLRAEEVRTFKNNEGKTLRATITAVAGNSVSLKLENGRVIQGAVTFFCPEDQEYIKKWAQSNPSSQPAESAPAAPAPEDYRFRVKATSVRKNQTKRDEGAVKVSYEDWAYKVELENIGRADLEDVSVEYRIYKKRGDVDAAMVAAREKDLQESGGLAFREGKSSLGPLKIRKKIEFETETLPMTVSDLKGGWYYPDGKDEGKVKDQLAGIWLRVVHGGKPVFEDKSTIKAPVTW